MDGRQDELFQKMYQRGNLGEPWAYQTYSAHETVHLACLDLSLAVNAVYAGLNIPLPDTLDPLAQEEE
jgi:hypothetical protein